MEWGNQFQIGSEKDGAVYKTQVDIQRGAMQIISMVKLEGYDKAKIKGWKVRHGMRKMRDYMPQRKKTHYDQRSRDEQKWYHQSVAFCHHCKCERCLRT